MAQTVVTLGTVARSNGFREPRPVEDVGVTKRIRVLTTRSVTVLALHIGDILKCRRHGGPIAIGEHSGEHPTGLRGHVIEAAIGRIRVGVEAHRMAFDAVLTEVIRALAINGIRESMGMKRLRPRCGHVLQVQKVVAPVAQTARVGTQVSGPGDFLG